MVPQKIGVIRLVQSTQLCLQNTPLAPSEHEAGDPEFGGQMELGKAASCPAAASSVKWSSQSLSRIHAKTVHQAPCPVPGTWYTQPKCLVGKQAGDVTEHCFRSLTWRCLMYFWMAVRLRGHGGPQEMSKRGSPCGLRPSG